MNNRHHPKDASLIFAQYNDKIKWEESFSIIAKSGFIITIMGSALLFGFPQLLLGFFTGLYEPPVTFNDETVKPCFPKKHLGCFIFSIMPAVLWALLILFILIEHLQKGSRGKIKRLALLGGKKTLRISDISGTEYDLTLTPGVYPLSAIINALAEKGVTDISCLTDGSGPKEHIVVPKDKPLLRHTIIYQPINERTALLGVQSL